MYKGTLEAAGLEIADVQNKEVGWHISKTYLELWVPLED